MGSGCIKRKMRELMPEARNEASGKKYNDNENAPQIEWMVEKDRNEKRQRKNFGQNQRNGTEGESSAERSKREFSKA